MDWDEMAKRWLATAPDVEVAFAQIFDALFGAAALRPGEAVLDVGCGTGPTLPLIKQKVGPDGQVTGIDIAPPLLARARERVGDEVALIEGDAGRHDFAPGIFDAVLSNFGIMFFEDGPAAFANLRRATRKGGRLAATVWGTPPDNPWFSVPRAIVDGIVPDIPRPDPLGPGPMRFGDPSGLLEQLESGGWAPRVETHDLLLLPPGPPEQVAALVLTLNVGMMLRGLEVSDSDLARIEAALVETYRGQDSEGRVRVPARIHVVTAHAV
ncbi:class I SAM-dependent methyltransferase [Jannaschia seohaensis]|uniref:Methyltransferase domain-containing protein n=1 Tax=Jannaschia seohaensis TaxID=475081 RepID=A0A2Y9C5V7_9RHOB|nr:class I SAM-dependent methyltransferase [Jannaschia seohaensis]PWJ21367.1 methyltransferase family protein [Jannaschia seohaensis]SSA41973.1 Methyltransferase domain-containing protein [Jannaschia seohaensis]